MKGEKQDGFIKVSKLFNNPDTSVPQSSVPQSTVPHMKSPTVVNIYFALIYIGDVGNVFFIQ